MKKIILTFSWLSFVFLLKLFSQNINTSIFTKQSNYYFKLDNEIILQQVNKILLVDINSDDLVDVVCLTNQTGDIIDQQFSFLLTFINDGNGSFYQDQAYNCNSRYIDAASGLINEDNFNDIVLVGDSLCILVNDGKGHFQFECLPYNLEGTAIKLSKLNNDIYDDIVISRPSLDTSFVVLLNNGLGVFEDIQYYKIYSINPGEFVSDIDCLDLNNDTTKDISLLIWRNDATGNIYTFLNDGDSNFNQYKNFDLIWGGEAESFSFIDFNKDGFNDIAVQNNYPGGISIIFGQGNGIYADETFYTSSPADISVFDFDNDSFYDIAFTERDSLKFLINNMQGIFIERESYNIPSISIKGASLKINGCDIDKDGDIDVVVSNFDSVHGGFTIFENSSIPTDIKKKEENAIFSQGYKLIGNYPNPFNPNTVISYNLPKCSFVELKVYDLLGRVIATLVNKEQLAGKYEVIFSGNNLSSGLYLYKLKTENFTKTKIMQLLK